MGYKVVIIDDEQPARAIIRNYLGGFPELEIVAECSDGFTGLKTIQEEKPDLIFLDIQMPRLTGFELLELIEEPPLVIFSTAYDQYALQAFEKNATDYLLKPYSKDRFEAAVKKALEKLKSGRTSVEEVKNIVGTVDANPELINRIAIKNRNKVSVVPVSDIIYLEAEGDYVMIHTKDARHLKEKTMKYFETHLDPAQFVRIHRSSIVNIEAILRIELYDKESYMVHLKNGSHLKASISGYKLLKQILKL